jgi:hypothetical protein
MFTAIMQKVASVFVVLAIALTLAVYSRNMIICQVMTLDAGQSPPLVLADTEGRAVDDLPYLRDCAEGDQLSFTEMAHLGPVEGFLGSILQD